MRLAQRRQGTGLRLLVGIVALAVILRVWDIADPSLWADELYSISFSRVPMNMLWGDWMVRETNPPAFYSMLKGWIGLFGEHDAAVRMLPIAVGLLVLGAIFQVTKTLHSRSAALVAIIFASVSAQQVAFSLEVRGYIFGALFASLVLLSLFRIADIWKQVPTMQRGALPWLVCYALAGAAAFYTHTTLAILPLLANVCMAWIWYRHSSRAPRALLHWLAANGVLLILCLWWGLMVIRSIREGAAPVGWIPAPNLKDVVAIMSHMVATRSFELGNLVFAAAFGAVMLWGVRQLPAERRIIVATIGLGAPLLMVLVSFARPVFIERTVFWLQSIYIACLAVGLVSIPWKRWRAPLIAGAVAVMLADTLTWSLTSYREPWRQIADVLRENATPRDVVLFYNSDAGVNLGHYCRLRGCGETRWLALEELQQMTVLPEHFPGAIVKQAELANALRGVERVWALRRAADDPTPALSQLADMQSPNLVGPGEDARIALSLWALRNTD